MALFPIKAENAVHSSVAMHNKLDELNQKRQLVCQDPIQIGIGLNTGTLMLGTVGGENRMDSTVISDAVNVASRIEGMTKQFGASILIRESCFKKLDSPNHLFVRMIGMIDVKDKAKPVNVFEILDGLPEESKNLKLSNLDSFEKAIN